MLIQFSHLVRNLEKNWPGTFPQTVLGFLVSEDLEKLYHFARDFGFRENSSGYLSKCDFCFHIRKYLFAETEAFSELRPKEFYLHSG
jgi:hypothetical protein